jgi:hypothetical protein
MKTVTNVTFFRAALLSPLVLAVVACALALVRFPDLMLAVPFVCLYCAIPYLIFVVLAWRWMTGKSPKQIVRFVVLAPLLLALVELLFLAVLVPFRGTRIGSLFASPQPVDCYAVPLFTTIPVGYVWVVIVVAVWLTAKAIGIVGEETQAIRALNLYVVSLFVGVGGVVASLFFSETARMILSILVFASSWLEVTETRLKTPAVYGPVADRLILYCQSDPNLFPESLGPAWFPKEVQNIGSDWGVVRPDKALVEFGGGFYHFGYELSLKVPAPSALIFGTNSPPVSGTNVWQLSILREGSEGLLLATRRVPASSRLSTDQLLGIVLDGYDRLLTSKPADDRIREGKILFLLRFGKAGNAKQVCKEWIDLQPEYRLPRFIYAHIRSRSGELDAASSDFSGWVSNHKNFYNYIYLFLFDMREGRNDAALAAIREALNQSFAGDEPEGEGANKFYLGYNGAVYAFVKGDYQLCLAVCDKILADPRQGEDSLRRDILKVKAAAHLVLGSQQKALEDLKKIPRSEMAGWGLTEGDQRTNQIFLAAISSNDVKFVGDYRSWKGEFNDWYSPIQTPGAGSHSQTDTPTLYRKDWREQVGF